MGARALLSQASRAATDTRMESARPQAQKGRPEHITHLRVANRKNPRPAAGWVDRYNSMVGEAFRGAIDEVVNASRTIFHELEGSANLGPVHCCPDTQAI